MCEMDLNTHSQGFYDDYTKIMYIRILGEDLVNKPFLNTCSLLMFSIPCGNHLRKKNEQYLTSTDYEKEACIMKFGNVASTGPH